MDQTFSVKLKPYESATFANLSTDGLLDHIIAFGEDLIRTEDLDPVYVAIWKARLPADQLSRLLLSYWAFYHLGSAAYTSERSGQEYWEVMRSAAANVEPSPLGGRWPRSAERRHFRGQKCVDAVDWLSQQEPEAYVESLSRCRTAQSVMEEVKRWPQFGPWIAFKAADMMECCFATPIEFDPNIGMMYREPRAALDILNPDNPERPYQLLLSHFSTFRAPPIYNRLCGPQEVETVLCKWKSSLSGHYHVGKDTREVIHGLEGWGATAKKLQNALK